MGMVRDPRFEATVSPALARLLTASRRALRDPAGSGDDPAAGSAGSVAEPAAGPGPSGPTAPDWRPFALRRDGARPLCFAGLAVLRSDRSLPEAAGPEGGTRRSFRLFVTPDRRLVAHLAVLPAETLAARPIHRAAYLDGPADLARFVAENDPSDCAAVLPGPAASGPADAPWAGLRLVLPLSPEHCAGAPPTEGRPS